MSLSSVHVEEVHACEFDRPCQFFCHLPRVFDPLRHGGLLRVPDESCGLECFCACCSDLSQQSCCGPGELPYGFAERQAHLQCHCARPFLEVRCDHLVPLKKYPLARLLSLPFPWERGGGDRGNAKKEKGHSAPCICTPPKSPVTPDRGAWGGCGAGWNFSTRRPRSSKPHDIKRSDWRGVCRVVAGAKASAVVLGGVSPVSSEPWGPGSRVAAPAPRFISMTL